MPTARQHCGHVRR